MYIVTDLRCSFASIILHSNWVYVQCTCTSNGHFPSVCPEQEEATCINIKYKMYIHDTQRAPHNGNVDFHFSGYELQYAPPPPYTHRTRHMQSRWPSEGKNCLHWTMTSSSIWNFLIAAWKKHFVSGLQSWPWWEWSKLHRLTYMEIHVYSTLAYVRVGRGERQPIQTK